jgi:hypothetical protein
MEALTGVSVTLLTIYDMCKAADKEMEIGEVKLLRKTKSLVASPQLSSRGRKARRGRSDSKKS